MRYFIFALCLITLVGCERDVTDRFASELPAQIVVNSFFSPGKNWKVYIGKTVNLGQKPGKNPVKNATVVVYENGSTPIELHYDSDGQYISNEKPRDGTYYRLSVKVPGYDEITAIDTVPPPVRVESVSYDTLQRSFPSLDQISESFYTYRPKFSFPGQPVNLNCRTVRPPNGTTAYYLDDESFRLMALHGLPQAYLDALRSLKNEHFTGSWQLIRACDDLLQPVDSMYYMNFPVGWMGFDYYAATEKEPIGENNITSFDIFTHSGSFQHIGTDNANLFASDITGLATPPGFFVDVYELPYTGNSSSPYKLLPYPPDTVHYDITPGCYLQVYSLSPAGYQYQTSYVKQVTGRTNLFDNYSSVYSNINGGVGIFAGVRDTICPTLYFGRPKLMYSEHEELSLTDESFAQMREAGIADVYINALMPLKGRVFPEPEFSDDRDFTNVIWETMRKALGEGYHFDESLRNVDFTSFATVTTIPAKSF